MPRSRRPSNLPRSRRPSNVASSTEFQRVIPDSYPDDYRDRGRHESRAFRGDNSFYRRGFSQSRERNRTFDYNHRNQSNSFGGNAELGHERHKLVSRKSMQDYRLVAMPSSSSPDSKRTSRQSSPKVNSSSRPASPKSDLPRSGAARPITAPAPSVPRSNFPTVDGVMEESPTSSKTDLPDETTKDPRLRRSNTNVKPNSETAIATPTVTSPQHLTSAANTSAPFKDQSKDINVGSLESTTYTSNAPNTSPSIPETPRAGSSDTVKLLSALSNPTTQNRAAEAMDVTMTDVNQSSSIVASTTQDPHTAVQPSPGTMPSSNLMDTFMKLMTDFADQVSTTSILKYKKDIAKQKSSRCKYNDRRNRENFKDYPVTIEQGTQARQLAERELASVDQKLKDQVEAQSELARTMAGFLVSQIEQQKGAQDVRSEKAIVFQKNLDKVEELSTSLNSALAEVRQVKLNSSKSVKEAYELVERATSACQEAQQAAQKTFTQVNDVSVRVNELSRNAAARHKVVLEDEAQIGKVTSIVERLDEEMKSLRKHTADAENDVKHLDEDMKNLRKRTADAEDDVKHLEDDMKSIRKRTTDALDDVKHLEDDMKSLRKRTAIAEDEVKRLWNLKTESVVLEGMRKDFNGDVVQLKKTQKELLGQVKSLEADVKKRLQSYETPPPAVDTHSKKLEETSSLSKTSHENSRQRMYGIEIPKSTDPEVERCETPAQGLPSDIEDLRRSFQGLSEKIGSSASQSDLVTLRESIARLEIAIEKSNVAKFSETLDAYRKDVEIDHEELRELTKEVDELHTGQDQIRDTFTAHNGKITERVDRAEKGIDEISKELKVAFEKAEEAQSVAKQINGMSKRVEATMAAATARPTPPSAPPTPQMHQSAQLSGRGASPVIDSGVLTVRLNEVAHDLMQLKGYINSQFFTSQNLPATLSSLNQAILNLQGRYNNLTTEPVIRAMVQQMQLMYPYASTAQNDIRDIRAAVSELEKLPPKIGSLTTQMDLHAKDIAKLDQKINDQAKERVSSDKKQESLVMHVKEERDNLKQHVQEQHEKLKQQVEKQHRKIDQSISAIKEESIISVAQVAAKVSQLEKVVDAWALVKKAERLPQLSNQGAAPKSVTQAKVNKPTASRASPKQLRPSSPTRGSSPSESDSEALLKNFQASTRGRRVVARSSVSDTDDSDAPLAVSRTNSSKSGPTASPNRHVPGTSGKRKRAHDTSNDLDERQPLWEVPSSPSGRKVPRRS